jgi:signal peptidase
MIEKITGFFKEGEIGRVILKDLFYILLIGGILFGVSGVWPPLVAIESGSMEPNLHRGDLVFIVDVKEIEEGGLSITTRERMEGNPKFGEMGDVIVFNTDGSSNIPVIHRVEFLVEEGEDWYERGNPNWVVGKDCGAMSNCPAPHKGYITKGDNNGKYDQSQGISGPVKSSWIKGTAEGRIPWVGYIKLVFNEIVGVVV